ncbi:carbohydrate ABC transporter substrate-binding protein, CUT1 family [Nakamurella panacisegetis]|uniref:Carbohydrate ABC transporter substrate-binding protein, CUT1 family n=1 Tax=Nakamurella panacisegetis TaxID=1090615 RepID=A0A1H0QU34_9ACTN|nr:extracellular solute-binding protein [Nakamurella panacisegetis]SDP20208.1 carbohydrate ABC transporter substrate-binding protein, CUT1 family [Nakamurella panacisegetis]
MSSFPSMPRGRRRLLVLGAAAGLALAGCSSLTPGSSASSSSSSATGAGPVVSAGASATGAPVASGSAGAGAGSTVNTAVPSEKVELKLAFTDSPDMTKELIAAFEKKYPQVTITSQYTQFNDYVKSLKLAMSSDSAPDLAQYNAAFDTFVAAGLIRDLSAYETAYGWDKTFPKSALDELRVDPSGKILGTGALIAVPGGLSLVGLYYNKQLLAKSGVSAPPATLTDLEADLAKAKAAGITPISVGALDTGGLHVWASLMNVSTDVTAQKNWIDGKAGSNIVTPEAVKATQTFADWAKAGYFPAAANGTGENDSATAFSKGASVFHINGNWAAAQLDKAMGANVGFEVMPPAKAGGQAVGNGFSVSYSISAKSKHPEAAAAFLNFLQSPEASVIEDKGGFLPPNASAAPAATGVKGDLKKANQAVVAADGLIPFPDFAAPAMLDSLESGLQSVIAGRMQAQDFLQSLQTVWTAYHGK